jgi:hypothetical protein
MRVALPLLLISALFISQAQPSDFPDEAKAHHWRMLDTGPRARVYASWCTLPVTEAQFRKMQLEYRPHDFDVWTGRLRQLRPGMTERQVLAVLRAKEVWLQLAANPGFSDIVLLDHAYFAEVYFSQWPHRMTWAKPPLAITYEIKRSKTK